MHLKYESMKAPWIINIYFLCNLLFYYCSGFAVGQRAFCCILLRLEIRVLYEVTLLCTCYFSFKCICYKAKATKINTSLSTTTPHTDVKVDEMCRPLSLLLIFLYFILNAMVWFESVVGLTVLKTWRSQNCRMGQILCL